MMERNIVTIHQPNYLPHLGFFDKASRADILILLDNVEFTKGGYQNRVKIKSCQGTQWLTVPIIQKNNQPTNQVRIASDTWIKKHRKTLYQNYAPAPHFKDFEPFDEWFTPSDNLTDVNEKLIKLVLWGFLNRSTSIVRASELDIKGHSSELLYKLVKAVGGKTYLSGASGKDYLDEKVFKDVKITYHDFKCPRYNQLYEGFTPGLSIIDLLFNKGRQYARGIVG